MAAQCGITDVQSILPEHWRHREPAMNDLNERRVAAFAQCITARRRRPRLTVM